MGKNKKVDYYSYVKNLLVVNYYDLDGSLIEMERKTYQNVNVIIVEKSVSVMGVAWTEKNLKVNDEIIGYNVISRTGNSDNLVVYVCDDAG